MTLWEFSCAIEGHQAFNRPEEKAAPEFSNETLAELGIEGF
ncbi:hypothetical protein ABE562_06960 [Brucella intermedia]|jgi:hypothetical protein|nr:hypothetical protein [Brucella intermedia]